MSDWGQGAKNNNIGWGQGAVNNDISWGSVHEDSWSGDTDIVGLDPIETIINAFEERVALDGGTFEAESCLNTTLTELNNEGLLEEASLVITPNAVEEGKLFSIVPTDGSGDLSVVRATTKTRVNSLGVIESVPMNVAALDYTDSTCPSILVEPQRTNLMLRSNDLTNVYYGVTGATIAQSSTDFLNGEKAFLLSETATTGFHRFGTLGNLTATIGSTFTFSCYLKKNAESSTDIVRLKAFWGSPMANFNIATGEILYSQICTPSISNMGNGWFRCSITFVGSVSSSGPVNIEFTNNTNNTSYNYSYVGNVNANVFVAGWQYEAGANATSYIPTVASAVTRNADVISKTGLSGIATITETFENGTTNVISGSPTSYTMSQGRIKQVIGI
jgi:hypothetical protein